MNVVLKGMLAGVFTVLFSSTLFAEEDAWENFVPPADDQYDWVQMDSGEWFKGEIKAMYNFSLEFDSDELDLITLDMDDVRRIRSADRQRVLLETGRRETVVQRGAIFLEGDRLQIINGEDVQEYDRRNLVSIVGGAKNEWDNWSGSFSIGATFRGGNTETLDVTSMANLRRRTAVTRLNLDYIGNYSVAGEVETAKNHRVNGYFDWFLTSRLYWQALSAEYYRDPFSNIQDQYSIASGIGYDLVRTSRTEWTMNAGAGYQQTIFVSVLPEDPGSSESPFGTFGTRFDHEISGNLDFLIDYNARFLNEASGKYTHHLITTLSFEFIGDLDLDISLIWDRINNPTPGEDESGNVVVPENDDYQLVVGVAYDF